LGVAKHVTLGSWRIKPVGIGTWQAKSRAWGSGEPKEVIEAIVKALTEGVNLIDTAEAYGWGGSEELVSEALKKYGSNDVLIATKLAGCNASPGKVVKHAEASRRRLGLDAIGLYQIHWPPSNYTDECRVIREMESLIDSGLTYMIGLSNYDSKDLRKALNCLRKHELVSDQVEYSLVQRAPERKLLPDLKREGMALIGWGTLAKGALAGKTEADNLARFLDLSFRIAAGNKELQEAIKEISKRHGVSRAAVVIRWSIEKGAIPLVGLRREKHVKSLVEALNLSISEDELAWLDKLTYKYIGRSFTRVVPRLIPNEVICILTKLLL